MAEVSEECKRTFKAALWCLEHNITHPEVFIRELAMTAHCDSVYNLSRLRNKIVSDLGDKTYTNVINYNETMVDFRKAAQIVFHHKDWALYELRKAIV